MKTLKQFHYFRPQTISKAVFLLSQYKERAKIIAGGTDLLVMMKDGLITPKYIIDIKSISQLDFVEYDLAEGLTVGALTRIATLVKSDIINNQYTALHEACQSLGTIQVRNMATIGGNVCRSSPSADTIPALLVFDARLNIRAEKERTLSLEEFFTGPGVNVLNNEIITEIYLPPQQKPYGSAFQKIGRTSEDLAKVNCAVKVVMIDKHCEDIRIALGSVAPTPIRAKHVEQAIRGEKISDSLIENASAKVVQDIDPISDSRSNSEYRAHISKILIKSLIRKSIQRLKGK